MTVRDRIYLAWRTLRNLRRCPPTTARCMALDAWDLRCATGLPQWVADRIVRLAVRRSS